MSYSDFKTKKEEKKYNRLVFIMIFSLIGLLIITYGYFG